MGDGRDGGGVHAGEQVVGTRRGPAGGGIGDTATPLEDEGQRGESEWEDGEEEEELRSEGLGRRRRL